MPATAFAMVASDSHYHAAGKRTVAPASPCLQELHPKRKRDQEAFDPTEVLELEWTQFHSSSVFFQRRGASAALLTRLLRNPGTYNKDSGFCAFARQRRLMAHLYRIDGAPIASAPSHHTAELTLVISWNSLVSNVPIKCIVNVRGDYNPHAPAPASDSLYHDPTWDVVIGEDPDKQMVTLTRKNTGIHGRREIIADLFVPRLFSYEDAGSFFVVDLIADLKLGNFIHPKVFASLEKDFPHSICPRPREASPHLALPPPSKKNRCQ
jgi:hypothetical protein